MEDDSFNSISPKDCEDDPLFFYDVFYSQSFWSPDLISPERFALLKDSVCFESQMSKTPKADLINVAITSQRELLLTSKRLSELKGFAGNHVSLLMLRHSSLKFDSTQNAYFVELSRGPSRLALYSKSWRDMNVFYELVQAYCPKEKFEHLFKKLEQLGSGAYSNVFQVQRRKDKLLAAAKFIKTDKVLQKKVKESLFYEITIMVSLEYHGVPKFYDLICGENELVIVMEYIPGSLLFRVIKERKIKEIEEKVTILQGLIDVVKYLHKNKIIHRDIKPENIILRNDDIRQPVLIDYGFAVWEDDFDDSIRCGTPGYIAPEVFERLLGFTPKSDVFSVGVVFFMLVTSSFPFAGANNNEMVEKNKKGIVTYRPQIWDKVRNEVILSRNGAPTNKEQSKNNPGALEMSNHLGDSDLNVGNEDIRSQVAISVEKYKMNTFYKVSMTSLNSFSNSRSNKDIEGKNRLSHFATLREKEKEQRSRQRSAGNTPMKSNTQGGKACTSLRDLTFDKGRESRSEKGNPTLQPSNRKVFEAANFSQKIEEDPLENIDSPRGRKIDPSSNKNTIPIVVMDLRCLESQGSTVGISDANDTDDGPGLTEKMQQYCSVANFGFLFNNKSLPAHKLNKLQFLLPNLHS